MAEYANQIGRSSTSASTSYGSTSDTSTVGKQSLAGQQPAEARNELVERVKARAGAELLDGGGFAYVVTPEGAFRITNAPETNTKSIGAVITMTGPWAKAWFTLVDLLDRTGDGQCIEPPHASAPDQSIGQPSAPAPAPKDSAPKDSAPKDSAPKDGAPKDGAPKEEAPGSSAPADTDSLFWVHTTDCYVKNARGSNIKPLQPIPRLTKVRVLEKKQFSDFTNARIVQFDGTEIGWASFQHMTPFRRPPQQSSASAQMAAVHAAASAAVGSSDPNGFCYAHVKRHILNGGGYGDILDIANDERFEGLQGLAHDFYFAVQKHGAAELGLKEVGGLPMDVAAGTILVMRDTPRNGFKPNCGDISIVDGVHNGVLHCFNDGNMTVRARPSDWEGEGKMASSILGMYQPIDRK